MIFSPETSGVNSPHETTVSADSGSAVCESMPTLRVSERLHDLSDEELEAHIRDCGELFKQAWARWEADSDFADRGDAERWLMLQNQAVRARSRAMVARMERDRGLR